MIVSTSVFRFIFAQSNEVAGISLPDESDEELFKILLTIAFIFKFISIIQMIVSQTSVDLFFIDWEREKPIAEGDQGKGLMSHSDLCVLMHI